VWRRRRSGKRVVVRVEPFVPLTTGQRERLEEEVTRIGRILQASPALSLGPIR